MLKKEIETKLANYQDAYLEKDWGSTKAIKLIQIEADKIEIEITLGYPFAGLKKELEAEIKQLLMPLAEGRAIHLKLSTKIDAHVGKQGIAALPEIKNIIAVASGKGGVGKSTVAINLALALAKEGARVGLLDADIYGPSQPTMLGTTGQRPYLQDKTFLPIEQHGIQTMSIGYLVDAEAALAWRGPMIGKALQQMLFDTRWQGLDYLVIDLPPGTGDIQLTLCQKVPVSGAVIVTTPQDIALSDVRRACEMFSKLNVPILGIIENMSLYHCPKCGHEEPIFGKGGGEMLAKEYHTTLMGSIPLDIHIREMTDSGLPPVVQDENSHYAKPFREIARKMAAKISLQPKDYSNKFPNIVVDPKRQ